MIGGPLPANMLCGAAGQIPAWSSSLTLANRRISSAPRIGLSSGTSGTHPHRGPHQHRPRHQMGTCISSAPDRQDMGNSPFSRSCEHYVRHRQLNGYSPLDSEWPKFIRTASTNAMPTSIQRRVERPHRSQMESSLGRALAWPPNLKGPDGAFPPRPLR